MKIYDFTVKDGKGNDVLLKKYEGKVLLIVNTATECGYTPQYNGLQALYEKYEEEGFVVLDFPCNQFAGQAPGTSEEIAEFCMRRFAITFPQFGKIEVNGDGADPLYKYLKEEKSGSLGKNIKWNFTKFLVDRDGTVVKRFGSATTPEKLEKDVKEIL